MVILGHTVTARRAGRWIRRRRGRAAICLGLLVVVAALIAGGLV